MRGFAERVDVEVVTDFLAGCARDLPSESVGLLACVGRVLAEEVRAEVDVPGFARSAMDGYAVRGEDTFGASEYDPLRLTLVGESMPGHPFAGTVGAGQAVRIMTGAPVPEGADAVVMAEVCEEDGDTLRLADAVAPHKHVGVPGEDIRVGTTVLTAGRRLRPQDAGLLSSIGVAEIACVRQPRVQLVITGDELLPPGTRPEGPRIADSNSVVLGALAERDGGVLLPHVILPDRPEVIADLLGTAPADVLLVSGGSSVGIEDHAPRLVAELGRLDFHGVSMRPSSPAGIGRLPAVDGTAERFVFLLPGNPVSCLCAYEFFAGPTLRRLGGRSSAWPHRRIRLPLARKITSAIGRTDYVRVAIEEGRVVPIATSGASILSSTVRAAGAVIVPRELEGMPEGAQVDVVLYDDEVPG
ncbi:MAG: molybdopterin molybdotransferase MoeA [bacterium]|nr:molybdopterin molybdotransferase MoeA [bacterium]MCP5065970.1 molybdopterin molybdotransferase MoeA [bacterium]